MDATWILTPSSHYYHALWPHIGHIDHAVSSQNGRHLDPDTFLPLPPCSSPSHCCRRPDPATLLLLLPYALHSWAQVTPEQWLVPRLQHLNLFGARHLDSTSVHVMLSSCPGLKHLNLSECCQYLSVSFLHHLLATSTSILVSVRLSWAKLGRRGLGTPPCLLAMRRWKASKQAGGRAHCQPSWSAWHRWTCKAPGSTECEKPGAAKCCST